MLCTVQVHNLKLFYFTKCVCGRSSGTTSRLHFCGKSTKKKSLNYVKIPTGVGTPGLQILYSRYLTAKPFIIYLLIKWLTTVTTIFVMVKGGTLVNLFLCPFFPGSTSSKMYFTSALFTNIKLLAAVAAIYHGV